MWAWIKYNKTWSLIYWGVCPHWKKKKKGKEAKSTSPPQSVPCSLRTLATQRWFIPWDSKNSWGSLSGPSQFQRVALRAAELMNVTPIAAAGRALELNCSNYSRGFLAFFQNGQLRKPAFYCRPEYISQVNVSDFCQDTNTFLHK